MKSEITAIMYVMSSALQNSLILNRGDWDNNPVKTMSYD